VSTLFNHDRKSLAKTALCSRSLALTAQFSPAAKLIQLSFSTPVRAISNSYLKRSQDIKAGCPNRGFPFAERTPVERFNSAYLK